jgi:beta-ureidopropionase / N-carbamoyl-L-amino-acid hydrolase
MRPSERVSGKRLWQRHMDLACFGARDDGGVDRQALSDAEIEARAQMVAWGRSLGLSPFTDSAANLFLRFEGADSDLAPVLAGSHIDSQPTGGKFDGAYGVLAALESAQAMRDANLVPLRPIEVVAWMNEEGSRFAPGMTGSDLFTGSKELTALVDSRDATGVRLEDAIARVLAADVSVPHRPFKLAVAAYIEPHIEQGPLLERAKRQVGVVTGIQGTRRYRVRVLGEAAHAGTAERHERKDALMAAVRMIAAIDETAMHPADTKLTVGLFDVKPNAPSVVPAEVFFAIDLRHPDNTVVDRIDREIRRIVENKRGPCDVELKQIQHSPSLDFNPAIRSLIADVAAQLGIAHQDIYSAAGHDSRQLHYVCPTGMIFVPCRDGISHNPAEWSEPDDLTAGARVLADTVWHLANQR